MQCFATYEFFFLVIHRIAYPRKNEGNHRLADVVLSCQLNWCGFMMVLCNLFDLGFNLLGCVPVYHIASI